MGNPLLDGAPAIAGAAPIHKFYSNCTWIEGSAIEQLNSVAKLPEVRSVAAFPDLHPGKFGPVGCAILSGRIYPHLIGNDIGCGMSLFVLDIPKHKLRAEKAAKKLHALEGVWDGNAEHRLETVGLSPILHPLSLGTIGGGNHFCELQTIDSFHDEASAELVGLTKNSSLLLVHSGSRALGTEVFGRYVDFPDGLQQHDAEAYLQSHNDAVKWAKLNRQIIAERAAQALNSKCRLVTDSPHNLVEETKRGFLHRKGSAKADMPFVPIAGSRDAVSFLVKPVNNRSESLSSLAHGSGRKYDRRSMVGRVGGCKSARQQLERNSFGGFVVCEDRQLLIEEAPRAYKDPNQVLADLIDDGLAKNIATLRPLVTFKRATLSQEQSRNEKTVKLLDRRRQR